MTDNNYMENYLFIDSGRDNKMFTLKELIDGREIYLMNLSTDLSVAVNKAMQVSKSTGKPLDKNCNIRLFPIERADATAMENRLAEEEAIKAKNIEQWIVKSFELIANNMNPFIADEEGWNEPLDAMTFNSMVYWKNLTEFKSPVHKKMHEIASEMFAGKFVDPVQEKVGKENDMIEMPLTLCEVKELEERSFSGYGYETKYRYIFQDNKGRSFNIKTGFTKFHEAMEQGNYKIGEKVIISARVKGHYDGKTKAGKHYCFTILIRPKLIA